MTIIAWDKLGERTYEAGVDRCVLYVGDSPGVPWNGIISIQENPNGGASESYYFEGQKYLQTSSPEEYAATITAYTYPDAFGVCDGTARVASGLFILHQPRMPFSLSYRTLIANDVAGTAYNYKIHIVYNALAAPTQRSNKTLSDGADISDFVWTITATPKVFNGFKPSAHVVIDSRFIDPGALANIENILYGDSTDDPRIPEISELVALITPGTTITVIDNGDGTFTVVGPDVDVFNPTAYTMELDWTTVVETIPDDTYNASSL